MDRLSISDQVQIKKCDTKRKSERQKSAKIMPSRKNISNKESCGMDKGGTFHSFKESSSRPREYVSEFFIFTSSHFREAMEEIIKASVENLDIGTTDKNCRKRIGVMG